MKGKAWNSLHEPGINRAPGGETSCANVGGGVYTSLLLAGLCLPAWRKRKGKGMPPSCLAVLERKSKIPSAHKVPQGDEDEVGPTEHPQ